MKASIVINGRVVELTGTVKELTSAIEAWAGKLDSMDVHKPTELELAHRANLELKGIHRRALTMLDRENAAKFRAKVAKQVEMVLKGGQVELRHCPICMSMGVFKSGYVYCEIHGNTPSDSAVILRMNQGRA